MAAELWASLAHDWRGTPLKVGSVIVYPVRDGNRIMEAEVVEFTTRTAYEDPEPAIKVRWIGQSNYRGGQRTDDAGTESVLTRLDRVTVIN